MNKSKEMVEKTLEKLVEFNDDKDFLTVILSTLKNDYECEHLLRLIEKYDVRTADNVLIISILIGEAGDKTKRRGDYLKDIDSRIEGAMLEEDYDEYDEDDEEYNDEGEKLKGFDEEEYEKELTENDFCQILEDANSGDINAKWRLVNNIAMNKAEPYADDYDLDKIYYDNLCDLAAEGKTAAYIMLGDAVLKGTGCKQNTKEAIRWYEKAAENGEKFGNECIGEIYYFGEYISQDYKKAYEYYTKDEGNKSFCTLYHLGEMYRLGLYVEKDFDRAWEYYQNIVEHGENFDKMDEYYWYACYRLGIYVSEAISRIPFAEECYNKLSLEFLKNYTEKQKGQNVVFSPFSVMVLLLMLADATDGVSREEIISGVCKDIGFDEAKKFIRMLVDMLEDDGSFCSANFSQFFTG